jgi:AraC family transcriptional activator of pobA
LETLLAYSERFYQRQFITRRNNNHQLLDQLNHLLDEHFEKPGGLPTVTGIAEQLNVSPRYLSSLLRAVTGLTTQQHIHEKLINKAKELLSTTELSVGEIAYTLGFEHLPSFSKLFKAKTKTSPVEFRASFN